ncbi:MAG: hypothetical protein EOM40_04860 [Clostridia bacterium]|nr:hypothetical protein [Clostridia bacterium]NCC42442.1 hypothetical protein [Clostridia bacterium]
MTLLLETKEKLKQVYARYGTFLLPVFKFILAMVIFKGINNKLNFIEQLDSIFVLLIVSLICSILPLNIMVIGGVLLIIAQCYGVGIEVAGFALGLILLMIILYIRFTPKDALVILLTPIAFALKVPCIIPIGYGLTRTPSSAVSAGCGVVVYYFMELVSQKASVLQGAETKEIAQNLKLLLDGLLKNQDMMMSIIAFVTVLIIVNVIRRLSVDYAWQIAIFAGAISYIVIMAAGGLFIDVKTPIIPLVAGTIGAAVLAVFLEFFLFNVDYTRTEYLQFEDDEYYYYVKAVPKMSISSKNVTVKTISEEDPGKFRQEQPVDDAYIQRQQRGPVPQETISFTGFNQRMAEMPEDTGAPIQRPEEDQVENVDFESKLEESLKDLS